MHGAHQRLGWVHEAVLREQARLEDFEVYAAGPPAMIEALRAQPAGPGAAARAALLRFLRLRSRCGALRAAARYSPGPLKASR